MTSPHSLVLASSNIGKIREFSELFSKWNIQVSPQSAFNISSVPETGTTFVENAIIKARHAAKISGLPALADDSGLVVDALGGAPGIYSSRYAGDDASDKDNIDKLLDALQNQQNRRAHFQCVLVYMRHADDPIPFIAEGQWHGEIAKSIHGDGGFGYDPIFWLNTEECSAAQLDKDRKNSISHRGKALLALRKQLDTFFA